MTIRKYTANIQSQNGAEYSLVIENITMSGSNAEERRIEDGSINIDADFSDRIMAKTLSLSIVSTSDMEFASFVSIATEMSVTCKIARDGVLVFHGFLNIDSYEEDYSSTEEYGVSMDFRDFNSFLKELNYRPATQSVEIHAGIQSMFDILLNLVGNGSIPSQNGESLVYGIAIQCGLTVDDIAVGDEETILHHIGVNNRNFYDENYEPQNRRDVLKSILNFTGLNAVMFNDRLFLYDDEVYDARLSELTFKMFSNSGTYLTSQTFETNLNITSDTILNDGNVFQLDPVVIRAKATHSLFFMSDLFSSGSDYSYGVEKDEFSDQQVVAFPYMVTDESYKLIDLSNPYWKVLSAPLSEYPHGTLGMPATPTNPFLPQIVGTFDDDLSASDPEYYMRWVPSGGLNGYPQVEDADLPQSVSSTGSYSGYPATYEESEERTNNPNSCYPVFESVDFAFDDEDWSSVGNPYIQGDGVTQMTLDAKAFLSAGNPYDPKSDYGEEFPMFSLHFRLWLMPEVNSTDYDNAWCLVNEPISYEDGAYWLMCPDANNDVPESWRENGWAKIGYKWVQGKDLNFNSLRCSTHVEWDGDNSVSSTDNSLNMKKQWKGITSSPFVIPENIGGVLRVQVLNGVDTREHYTSDDFYNPKNPMSYGECDYVHLKEVEIKQYDSNGDEIDSHDDIEYMGYNSDFNDLYSDSVEGMDYTIETQQPYNPAIGMFGVARKLVNGLWVPLYSINRGGYTGTVGEVTLNQKLDRGRLPKNGLKISTRFNDVWDIFKSDVSFSDSHLGYLQLEAKSYSLLITEDSIELDGYEKG